MLNLKDSLARLVIFKTVSSDLADKETVYSSRKACGKSALILSLDSSAVGRHCVSGRGSGGRRRKMGAHSK